MQLKDNGVTIPYLHLGKKIMFSLYLEFAAIILAGTSICVAVHPYNESTLQRFNCFLVTNNLNLRRKVHRLIFQTTIDFSGHLCDSVDLQFCAGVFIHQLLGINWTVLHRNERTFWDFMERWWNDEWKVWWF